MFWLEITFTAQKAKKENNLDSAQSLNGQLSDFVMIMHALN